ncbi:hypothetical protein [Paenibacillus rigui]|uniref:hypothetical protein n=1 Tax=Paenibacillus rigui TaxID=554312 RepID=UPI001FE4F41E|nr:hypothetical protein [Paenibacillus rigui]
MKKTKQPGDNISLKTKKTEDPFVMQWINAQTNLMDSLRYLIENEIQQHGVRNLQACIPAERSVLVSAAAVLELPFPAVAQRPAASPLPVGVLLSGSSEIAAAREETAAAGVALQEAPEQAVGPVPAELDQRESAESSAPVEDDIDEEDIESWI